MSITPFLWHQNARADLLKWALKERQRAAGMTIDDVVKETQLSRSGAYAMLANPRETSPGLDRLARALDRRNTMSGRQIPLSLEAYLEEAFPARPLVAQGLPARWLWARHDQPVKSGMDACIRGAILLDLLLDKRAGNDVEQRSKFFHLQGELAEVVVENLLDYVTHHRDERLRATIILAQLIVAAPDPVLERVVTRGLQSPVGGLAAKPIRHALRILRHPEGLREAGITVGPHTHASITEALAELWAGNPLDIDPARCHLLSATRELVLQVASTTSTQRLLGFAQLSSVAMDPARTYRERSYAIGAVLEVPHRYAARTDQFREDGFGVTDSLAGAKSVAEEFLASVHGDSEFEQCAAVVEWVRNLELGALTDPPADELQAKAILGWRPADAASRIVSDIIFPTGARDMSEGTEAEQLAETALLSLDVIKRKNSLEALQAAGFSDWMSDHAFRLARDAAAPNHLRELGTFMVGYLHGAEAAPRLFAIALDLEQPAGSRHAALIGIAEGAGDEKTAGAKSVARLVRSLAIEPASELHPAGIYLYAMRPDLVSHRNLESLVRNQFHETDQATRIVQQVQNERTRS